MIAIFTMNIKNLLIESFKEVKRPKLLIYILIILFILTALYPSNCNYYRDQEKNAKDLNNVTYLTNKYLRHINTVAQIAIPIILMDKVGLVQAIYVDIATTISTHSLKRIFNDVIIFGKNIGTRPRQKPNNMPSGHSSMASSEMFFVARRYGWKFAIFLLPITLITMYARVALNCHTVSAILAGFILGALIAVIFTSSYKKKNYDQENIAV